MFTILISICLGIPLVFLLTGKIHLFWIIVKTFPRDIRLGFRFVKIKIILRIASIRNKTVNSMFDGVVQKNPNKVCFYFGEEEWTFKRVQDTAHKFGNYFQNQGFKKGDVVSLVMENRPEYVCIWLGLSKIGVITAFINYNLRFKPLEHCINASKSRAIIFGGELDEAINDLYKMEGNTVSTFPLYRFAGGRPNDLRLKAKDLQEEIKNVSTRKPIPTSPIKFFDNLCYIYTSGTTGLPKAAVIKHSRAFMTIHGPYYINGVLPDDVLYTPLPLYHIQGGLCGVGQALFHGVSVVLIKKFSASRFWKDCIKYEVTVSQYLGELCRYLLNQPPSPEDRKHKVRMMYGNGVRPEIWQEFLDRFNNPRICELYGATEGNSSLINFEGKVGSIGVLPRIASLFLKSTLIRVDPKTGEPIRSKNGLCQRCEPNELGEMIALIVEGDPIRQFDGYTDASATKKKIIYDIFKKGDSAFRSGDILVMDDYGYFYFKDRTGDTFRWKGENVSTSEVEGVISNYADHKDVVVYGVEIPNTDGKAGMASIADPLGTMTPEKLAKLAEGIIKNLPAYARPYFLRIIPEINTTGTFKLQKIELNKDGYNIEKVKDQILFFQAGQFVKLDKELYDKINSGKIRL